MNETTERKKIVFSGIQPTGVMTLGNYLGAVKNWGILQENYNCLYSIVDMHAITVRQDSAALRKNTLDAYALMLACGIDPEKSIAFIQSHVPAHAELSWILGCSTQFGELSRMTQFKDKSAKHADNINAGLFTYPVLMAADILLYKADLVPVGVDQKQHLELARNIAERFNFNYSNTFTVPEPYIAKQGAKIMSLADPTKKMSKSDENANGFISILDDEDTIIRKFKRAVTDSEASVVYRDGKGYGDFKVAVGQAVADHLKPVRDEFKRLSADKAYLEACYKTGAERASVLANRTLDKVKHKVGWVKR